MDFEFDDLFRCSRGDNLDEHGEALLKTEEATLLKRSRKESMSLNYVAFKNRSLEDFIVLKHIGYGGYGRVYQVQERGPKNRVFAMKLLKKSHLVRTNSVANTITERDILRKVRHPFIVKLHYSFQTPDRLCFIMDFVQGGQLFFHLRREAVFNEDLVRFYTAELVLALEYLHSHNIIHRSWIHFRIPHPRFHLKLTSSSDLKPENILVSASGHIVLTDFGLAKEHVVELDGGASTWCGTVEYMAPEMVRGQRYGKAADFWSVGILIYDMLSGKPPFRNKNHKKLIDAICCKRLVMPQFWMADTHAIVKGLTHKDPKCRLKLAEIKQHGFFKTVDWAELLAQKTPPPFIPVVSNAWDLTHFDKDDLVHPVHFSPADPVAREHEALFHGFSYERAPTPEIHDKMRRPDSLRDELFMSGTMHPPPAAHQ